MGWALQMFPPRSSSVVTGLKGRFSQRRLNRNIYIFFGGGFCCCCCFFGGEGCMLMKGWLIWCQALCDGLNCVCRRGPGQSWLLLPFPPAAARRLHRSSSSFKKIWFSQLRNTRQAPFSLLPDFHLVWECTSDSLLDEICAGLDKVLERRAIYHYHRPSSSFILKEKNKSRKKKRGGETDSHRMLEILKINCGKGGGKDSSPDH